MASAKGRQSSLEGVGMVGTKKERKKLLRPEGYLAAVAPALSETQKR